ncbi:Spy/CpxP family protein refolding chaperone [Rhodoferax sp. WC2427]|uniref:Spy/CpxP family protein refolding chaperone n=1 Tax=Rhodoferax sp. WC2427 TaxID=3234144 RepID=UPI003466E01B
MRFVFKRTFKRALVGIFGASLLVGTLSACAGRGGHAWGGPVNEQRAAEFRVKMVEKVGKKLDLNDAQKQLLVALSDALQAQRKALVGSSTDPRADIQALVAGAQFDRAKALALAEEKTKALQSQSPQVITAAANFYDALNPAQQQQVRDFMQHRGGWFRHG